MEDLEKELAAEGEQQEEAIEMPEEIEEMEAAETEGQRVIHCCLGWNSAAVGVWLLVRLCAIVFT